MRVYFRPPHLNAEDLDLATALARASGLNESQVHYVVGQARCERSLKDMNVYIAAAERRWNRGRWWPSRR